MRALLLVLDSVGCGPAPDSAAYGDSGANTLGHIFAAQPSLTLPALFSLGLWKILTADVFDARSRGTIGSFGRMRERSAGKDSTTGHWEMAGAILDHPFATFTEFPADFVAAISRDAKVEFLGNYARSGTTILEELGSEHLRTGKPILYTSADSVLQIAAHEQVIPRKRLYEICRIARRHADALRIGRVIARPFLGEPGKFERTTGRHDFSMVPPRTVLHAIAETGMRVEGVGKVNEIFGGSGITHSTTTTSNIDGLRVIDELWSDGGDGLIFANLVDFDMLYGHRRDVAGYARALWDFDTWLAGFLLRCEEEDLVIITADHGNDPTWKGTDHTREEVPLMVLYGGLSLALGTRRTFADVAATLAEFFRLRHKWPVGESFITLQQRHVKTYFHRR
ncbi:phosphopentomutase [Chthoniobacter flavus]|uniref:phosphopentomutase n=1 Tax=Chthoniobacter flavus TaxID=191863 RepID=UPI0010477002|nr:phosphopentomutase [Chthoniobacter flavus]TCO88536.1 phosphopentomutase [Chthoniobacter flavus]